MRGFKKTAPNGADRHTQTDRHPDRQLCFLVDEEDKMETWETTQFLDMSG